MENGKLRKDFWQQAIEEDEEGASKRNPFVEFCSATLFGVAAYLCVSDLFKDPVSASWGHAVVFGLASGVGAVIVRTRFLRRSRDSGGS